MVKNAGSRVFHGAMAVPCAILFILAIISSGNFAAEHNEIRRKTRESSPDSHYCILFTNSAGKKSHQVLLSEDHACLFAIWGEVSVSVLSLILGVLFVVNAIIGLNALSFFSIVELVIMILAGMLDFAVAIVISTGLDYTCGAFKDSTGKTSPCSHYDLILEDNTRVSFYHKLYGAKVTAWMGTVILVVLTVVHFILLCAYCHRHMNPDNSYGRLVIMTPIADDQEDDKVEVATV